MERYFIEGGIQFMSVLSLLFLIILSIAVLSVVKMFQSKNEGLNGIDNYKKHIKSVALLALVFGILGQVLGLFQIFDYLSGATVETAASVLARGIKITFYPTLYGIGIFLISILITIGLDFKNKEVK